MEELCNTFWGGHGCDLEKSDHTIHICGPVIGDRCLEYDSEKKLVRYMLYENKGTSMGQEEWLEVGWSDWKPCDYSFELETLFNS